MLEQLVSHLDTLLGLAVFSPPLQKLFIQLGESGVVELDARLVGLDGRVVFVLPQLCFSLLSHSEKRQNLTMAVYFCLLLY